MNTKGVEDGISDEQSEAKSVQELLERLESGKGKLWTAAVPVVQPCCTGRGEDSKMTRIEDDPTLDQAAAFVHSMRQRENKPAQERIGSMTKKCTCKNTHGHEGCVAVVDVSCGCVLHDDEVEERAPIPEERTAEMEEWVAVPDEQGWWWHWDGDKEHVPFMYSVLTSLSRKINREFIAYPDSRWCVDVGGKWMKAIVPTPPVSPEGSSR